MIDIILITKFVHEIAAAAMFGTWLCLAAFMVLAHRSHNTSVVALTSRFIVGIELAIMIPAMVLQPVSGIPLGWVVGLSPADSFWLTLSTAIFAVVLAAWVAALVVEMRIRNLSHQAVLDAAPLPSFYRRLFWIWCGLAALILIGMVVLFALMIWQPRPY
jgi:uncharacterized membrane protein